MKLIDELKDKIVNGPTPAENLILGIAAAGLISVTVCIGIYNHHIDRNLEPNAISTGIHTKIKNKDIDENGKYESVLYYKDKGKKRSVLLQYDKEKGYPVTKPYKIETESVTGKKTLKF